MHKYKKGERVLARIETETRWYDERHEEWETETTTEERIVEITHYYVAEGAQYVVSGRAVVDEANIIRVVTDEEMMLRNVAVDVERARQALDSAQRKPFKVPGVGITLHEEVKRLHTDTRELLELIRRSYV